MMRFNAIMSEEFFRRPHHQRICSSLRNLNKLHKNAICRININTLVQDS